MTAFVLMGVSGAGKTTIGRRVAEELKLVFLEGDEFHPDENVAKMSSGVALTDADREPWIDALARGVNERGADADVIIACSALSQFVRKRLRDAVAEPLHFIFLTAPPSVIEARLNARPRHFMKPGMLRSQFAALEPPANAITVDVNRPLDETCDAVATEIRKLQESTG
jgi:carbohydrate kinase (thermoresistant glucokinase family)